MLPAIGLLAVAGSLLIAVAWGVGMVFDDSTPWSQPLSWIPAWPVATCLWVAIGISRVIEWTSRRMAGTRLRPIALFAASGVTLFTLWAWSPWRLLSLGGGRPPVPGEITAAYWNLSWSPPPADAVRRLTPADLVVIANPSSGPERTAFHERTGGGTPDLRFARRLANWSILSRWPIEDVAYVRLPSGEGTTLPQPALEHQTLGVGLLTLDTAARIGRPITVWIVDLPSDPRLHRPVVMRAAADAVRAHAAHDRFATPDLVLGDFNTPRGARSLDLLVPGMTESHAAAGVGSGATWPRPQPLWAIDLAFASRDWRFHASEALETGSSLHRAIRVRVSPRVVAPSPPGSAPDAAPDPEDIGSAIPIPTEPVDSGNQLEPA